MHLTLAYSKLCRYTQGMLVCCRDLLECVSLCQDYVLGEVIEGGGEEEDSEPSNEAEAVAVAEKLNDRRVQLAGFLKLILFGVLDMSMAAPVFAQYVKASILLYTLYISLAYILYVALPPFWRPAEDGIVTV